MKTGKEGGEEKKERGLREEGRERRTERGQKDGMEGVREGGIDKMKEGRKD